MIGENIGEFDFRKTIFGGDGAGRDDREHPSKLFHGEHRDGGGGIADKIYDSFLSLYPFGQRGTRPFMILSICRQNMW